MSFSGTVVHRPDIGGVGAVAVDGYRGLIRRLDGTEHVDRLISTGTASPGRLTPRELEVLCLVADGKTNAEIGFALGMSEDTVKSHMRSLMDKFNTSTRLQLVLKALQTNILKLGELCLGPLDESGQPIPRALSDHESRLLAYLAAGCSFQEIATTLHYSPATVSVMVRNIRRKWGVRSTEEVAALARQRAVAARGGVNHG